MTFTEALLSMRWLADCGHWINGPIHVKREWLGDYKSECADCYLARFAGDEEEQRVMRETLEFDGIPLDQWHCWGKA